MGFLTIFGVCVVLLVGVLLLLAPKPHAGKKLLKRLPGTRGKEGHARFEAEREKAWPAMVREFGRSFEFDGLLATAEPLVVRAMLLQKPHNAQRSAIYKLLGKWIPFGNGILFMDGEDWQEHTRVARPIFHAANFGRAAPTMHRFAVEQLDMWLAQGGSTDNLLYDMRVISRNVLMHWGFGLDAHSPLAEKLSLALHEYSEWCFDKIPQDKRYNFPRNFWKLRSMGKDIHRLSQQVVATKAYTFTGEDNFVSAMVEAGLPAEVLSAEVNHIQGAHKAIAFTMTFALYELARHPEWVARMREEWARVLGGRAHPEHADLANLPVAGNVLKEVTRMHVVSMGVVRRTGEPLEVAGQTFPAGTETILALHALHRDPELWENPDSFDPSRFEKPLAKGIYYPFLDGTRRCGGMYLAEMQFHVVMHALLSRADVAVPEGFVPVMQPNMFATLESLVPASFSLV